MTHEDNFVSIFGNILPTGKNAYAVNIPKDLKNPISYISQYLDENGGKVMIKSNAYYICSTTCLHPDVVILNL